MPTGSPWSGYFQSPAGGHPYITRSQIAALERDAPDRVIETQIAGRSAKVFFLDVPYRLGEEVPSLDGFYLRRIPIRDVSAWPPQLANRISSPRFFSVFDCSVKTARFIKGGTPPGDRVEFELECGGHSVKAWLTGCPTPLLQCVATTINDHGVIDNRLVNLQEVRLRNSEG